MKFTDDPKVTAFGMREDDSRADNSPCDSADDSLPPEIAEIVKPTDEEFNASMSAFLTGQDAEESGTNADDDADDSPTPIAFARDAVGLMKVLRAFADAGAEISFLSEEGDVIPPPKQFYRDAHEAEMQRHVADLQDSLGYDNPMECPGCLAEATPDEIAAALNEANNALSLALMQIVKLREHNAKMQELGDRMANALQVVTSERDAEIADLRQELHTLNEVEAEHRASLDIAATVIFNLEQRVMQLENEADTDQANTSSAPVMSVDDLVEMTSQIIPKGEVYDAASAKITLKLKDYNDCTDLFREMLCEFFEEIDGSYTVDFIGVEIDTVSL